MYLNQDVYYQNVKMCNCVCSDLSKMSVNIIHARASPLAVQYNRTEILCTILKRLSKDQRIQNSAETQLRSFR